MRYLRSLTVTLLSALSSMFSWMSGGNKPSSPSDFRQLSIYQIMVASFIHADDGAPGYQAMWGPDDNTKNGNLKGVISALDHIKSLGVNAIWLTPIFDSSEAFGGEKLQATGYFTNNYFAIDPHFGTEEDFRRLVDEAHARGLAVILDGVFGHHGGVVSVSPSGYEIDSSEAFSDRGPEGGSGNVSYPASLPYFKEVATWWIDNFGIDGWRLDQAYQLTQNGRNYWTEIVEAVDSVTSARKDKGLDWGTLGYMVGEDWGTADVINRGVYRDGGLRSAFDFDGKERISGPMQSLDDAGLENGYEDIILTLSSPVSRGYLNNDVLPNLFLSNHDGYRVADHLEKSDPHFYEKLMTRHAILAAYSGPITIYYGDEYGDQSKFESGAQKDNIARTSGHLEARSLDEQRLKDYISNAMIFRAENPAMWRGAAEFYTVKTENGPVLIVKKTDPESSNQIVVIFSFTDTQVPVPQAGRIIEVKAWQPKFITITGK